MESDQCNMPWGRERDDYGSGITETDYGYTGQCNYADFGFM
ncbi:MAG: hypothetical protein N2D54_04895 [Chloroflexota bacterium]